MTGLGAQIFADLYECDPAVLADEDVIRDAMLEAARRCGATIVAQCFHRFSPHGVSGVVVIAESHLAIHTWPEHGYAAVDLFTCGDRLRPEACFSYLREAFRSRRHETSTVERGPRRPATSEDSSR
ncbi:adenosylmethionine decarboxylase [Sorangium sp. So ce1151]|uniref:adenosylmethionine decarboxylase n=1 Tax=Sorangium sp. So ce1151 TaxID=3133332 RepID=UPI003F621EB8